MRLIEQEVDVPPAPVEGIVVRRVCATAHSHLPDGLRSDLIVMEADNDVGAVSTYMQAGGQYGLHLLWLLVLLLPICYFI
jgi:hypothetical protein